MEAKRRKQDEDMEKDKLETRAFKLGKKIQLPVSDQTNYTPKQEIIKELAESYVQIFSEIPSKNLWKLGHKILDMIEFYESELEKEQKLAMETELARQTLGDKLFELSKEGKKLRSENTKLLEKTETDFLTGIYNKRKFESQLKTLINVANRTGDELSLIEFDLDGFKPVNDTYGHEAGDLVLQHITNEINVYVEKNLRESDIFVRFGGDEFAIILYKTDEDGAYEVAKRVKDIIDNSTVEFGGNDLSVKVTIGLKQYSPNETYKEFFGKTDAALYVGKESGKGKIVRYSEERDAIERKHHKNRTESTE